MAMGRAKSEAFHRRERRDRRENALNAGAAALGCPSSAARHVCLLEESQKLQVCDPGTAEGGCPTLVRCANILTGRMKSIIVGTAGHIDHGKTALGQALTGT